MPVSLRALSRSDLRQVELIERMRGAVIGGDGGGGGLRLRRPREWIVVYWGERELRASGGEPYDLLFVRRVLCDPWRSSLALLWGHVHAGLDVAGLDVYKRQ